MKIIQISKFCPNFIFNPLTDSAVQIGIEHLHSRPLFDANNLNEMFSIMVGEDTFIISEKDILEFNNLSKTNISCDTTNWDDYTFVTIGYEENQNS